MYALLFSLLVPLAAAQDKVATVEECPFTPVATPKPDRPPTALAPSRAFVECIVTAEVDGEGKPTPKQVTGCEEPFSSAARTGFANWRFKPCMLEDGRLVEGTIRVAAKFASSEFQRQGDAAYAGLMALHKEGKKQEEGCATSLRITPDGTVSELTSSDVTHCISAAKDRTLKHYHLNLEKPTACVVEMEVSNTRAITDSAVVKKCEGDVAKYALDTVSSFPWNSPIGGSEKYTVTVTLGPDKK